LSIKACVCTGKTCLTYGSRVNNDGSQAILVINTYCSCSMDACTFRDDW